MSKLRSTQRFANNQIDSPLSTLLKMVHALEDKLQRDLEQYAQAVQARYLRQKDLLFNAVYHRNDVEGLKTQLASVTQENERVHIELEHTQHEVHAWQVSLHPMSAVFFNLLLGTLPSACVHL